MDGTESFGIETKLAQIVGGVDLLGIKLDSQRELTDKDIKNVHSRLSNLEKDIETVRKMVEQSTLSEDTKHTELWTQVGELRVQVSRMKGFIAGATLGGGGIGGAIAAIIFRGT